MQTTTNHGLKKPDGTDIVNIEDLNYNADKIDSLLVPASTTVDGLMSKDDKTNLNDVNSKKHIHSNKSVIDTITSTLISNWNSAFTHISDSIKHITSDERTLWNTVSNKVDKVSGKGLSANDYTTVEKDKLSGITTNATKTEASTTNGKIKINGTETAVYSHPTTSGNNHIPSGGSSGQILRWSADGTAVWGADNNTVYGVVSKTANGLAPQLPNETTTTKYLRQDGTWAIPPNTTYGVATTSANGLMSSTDKSKLDGVAAGANNYVHPNDAGTRHVTDTEKATWNGKASTAVATTSANGLMSSDDKSKLDGIATGANNYTHPSTHPASMITGLVGVTYANSTNGEVFNDYTRNVASGGSSHAEGTFTKALEFACHAEGSGTQASGFACHAEGTQTIASGDYSHAEGEQSQSTGYCSHSEGGVTKATGDCSHAEGKRSQASGGVSHAEGFGTTASGDYSHAEGYNTISNGMYSHSEGIRTTTKGLYAHVEGFSTKLADMTNTNLSGSSADNAYNYWLGLASASKFSIAWGESSHCEGSDTAAFGTGSHAEGSKTVAKGNYSHAEGLSSRAIGNYSHAEGCVGVATGSYSHAEGDNTNATGTASHAEGTQTKAQGNYSHAGGGFTTASGSYSRAVGRGTKASGYYSFAEGYNTTAETSMLHVLGTYNKVNSGSASSFSASQNAFVIGNGSSASLANAFRVTYSGQTYGLSAFNTTGADYAEYFEWKDGNPDNEERIGYFVTLDGDKIRVANSDDDYILGIISGNQSVIGNASEDSWSDMYLRDEFDRLQYEEVEVEKEEPVLNEETGEMETEVKIVTETRIKLNPNYDSSIEYIPRSERKEWGVVGMLGQIKVRDDGTCTPNGYCTVGENGIATKSDNGYRVLKRVNESIVLVLFK